MRIPPSNPTVSRVRVVVALGLCFFAALLFFRTRPGTEDSEEKARAAILNVLASQVAAWNRGDLEAFMNGYWKSDELTFFSGDEVRQGWQETHDRFRKRYQAEGKEMGTLQFDQLRVDLAGPKSAIVRGRWQLTFKDGKPAGGLFTLLFRQESQGWCIVHDHTSAKPPPEVPVPPPGEPR
jgi:beta-aspartyl-peptidase (threonine type)